MESYKRGVNLNWLRAVCGVVESNAKLLYSPVDIVGNWAESKYGNFNPPPVPESRDLLCIYISKIEQKLGLISKKGLFFAAT